MEIEKIRKRLENHEERIKKIEGLLQEKHKLKLASDELFTFSDKSREHPILLKEILKSPYCHNQGGCTPEEILNIFRENSRPVVPKKIRDLLHVWKKNKKIDAIKVKGKRQLKYFWVEDESKRGS